MPTPTLKEMNKGFSQSNNFFKLLQTLKKYSQLYLATANQNSKQNKAVLDYDIEAVYSAFKAHAKSLMTKHTQKVTKKSIKKQTRTVFNDLVCTILIPENRFLEVIASSSDTPTPSSSQNLRLRGVIASIDDLKILLQLLPEHEEKIKQLFLSTFNDDVEYLIKSIADIEYLVKNFPTSFQHYQHILDNFDCNKETLPHVAALQNKKDEFAAMLLDIIKEFDEVIGNKDKSDQTLKKLSICFSIYVNKLSLKILDYSNHINKRSNLLSSIPKTFIRILERSLTQNDMRILKSEKNNSLLELVKHIYRFELSLRKKLCFKFFTLNKTPQHIRAIILDLDETLLVSIDRQDHLSAFATDHLSKEKVYQFSLGAPYDETYILHLKKTRQLIKKGIDSGCIVGVITASDLGKYCIKTLFNEAYEILLGSNFPYYNSSNKSKADYLKKIQNEYGIENSEEIIFIDNSLTNFYDAHHAGFTSLYANNNWFDDEDAAIYLNQLEHLLEIAENTNANRNSTNLSALSVFNQSNAALPKSTTPSKPIVPVTAM
jgi:hypothetical protein